jgi:hypothetical protein
VKLCTKCKIEKPAIDFHTNNQKKDKLTVHCRECSNARLKAWKQQNKEHIANYDRVWQQANKDKKSKNYKNWQVNNRAKVNSYNSYRRALELKATPSWLTNEQKSQIDSIYWLARFQQQLDDEQYHVDHIVPLRGKTVCGLHVPWNLQVIPAKENLTKGNKLNASI